jgi:FkbM family methyltransferase
MLTLAQKAIQLLSMEHGVIRALSWPVYSMASVNIVTRLKSSGVAPRTVVDVGANVGQFAVAAGRLFEGCTVIPFEPDKTVAEKLKKNVGRGVAANVRVTAVSDHVGVQNFHVNRDSQVSSLLPLGKDRKSFFQDAKVVEEVEVSVTTLDATFAGEQLAAPVLVKIDAQGAEDRVVKGGASMLRNHVTWIVVELAFSNLYEGESSFDDMVSILAELGFRFLKPLNFHVSPSTGDVIEMDALFVKTE